MWGRAGRCCSGVQVWGCLRGQVCEQGRASPSPLPSRAVGQVSTSSPTHHCLTWPWGWCCWPGPLSCSAPASSSWSNSSTPCSRGRWPKPSRRSSTLVSRKGTTWPPMPISTCHPQTCPRLPLTPNPDVPCPSLCPCPWPCCGRPPTPAQLAHRVLRHGGGCWDDLRGAEQLCLHLSHHTSNW